VVEAVALDQGSVWAAACRVVAGAPAALDQVAVVALAAVVPAAEVAQELMPAICGVRRGRVAAAPAVEVAPALGSAVRAVGEAREEAQPVPVVDMEQAAALRERRERRPADG